MTTVPVQSWLVAAALAGAVVLAWPARSRVRDSRPDPATGPTAGWMARWRQVWSALAAVAVPSFVDGMVGWLGGAAAAAVVWVLIERAEPADARKERAALQAELPHVVGLLGDALRAGRAPAEAVALVADALPGPASRRLADVTARLRLGVDPVEVWHRLEQDPALAPLGRALARSQRTGAPVVAVVERLAEEVARNGRGEIEDRARAVGVKAALPLGVCLLPAFLLVGIVPLVAGLLTSITLR